MSILGTIYTTITGSAHLCQQENIGTLKGQYRDYQVTIFDASIFDDFVDLVSKILDWFLEKFPAKEKLQAAQASLGDDFEVLDENSPDIRDDSKKIAAEKLLGDDYLTSATVNTYATDLMGKKPAFNFVPDFICKQSITSERIDEILNQPFKEEIHGKTIFIPFILKNHLVVDHIVILVLDPKNKTYEYYNSQGGALKKEDRMVLGTNLKASNLLSEKYADWTAKDNPTPHQKDRINCGRFVCWFMKQRTENSFDQITQIPKVDILKEKEVLAKDL